MQINRIASFFVFVFYHTAVFHAEHFVDFMQKVIGENIADVDFTAGFEFAFCTLPILFTNV